MTSTAARRYTRGLANLERTGTAADSHLQQPFPLAVPSDENGNALYSWPTRARAPRALICTGLNTMGSCQGPMVCRTAVRAHTATTTLGRMTRLDAPSHGAPAHPVGWLRRPPQWLWSELTAFRLELRELVPQSFRFGFCGAQPPRQRGAAVWRFAWRWRGRGEDCAEHGRQHGLPLPGSEVG
jgi:hypothetical protein